MAKEKIKDEDSELAQNFNFFSLMKFVFPSIFAFVFIALYQMVDGFFIQEFVGDLAIATVNLYLPILYLFVGYKDLQKHSFKEQNEAYEKMKKQKETNFINNSNILENKFKLPDN
jgi:hypothetical protein